MDKVSLTALARQHLAAAHDAHSGRSAHTVYGGHQHTLRQTLIALTAGTSLDDHESPGEATPQVLHGRVCLTSPDTSWMAAPAITSSSPPPATACTPSTIALCCSRSPNPFSGKAIPLWPRSASKVRPPVAGPIWFTPRSGRGPETDGADPGDHTDSTDL
jgi:hypothetical protein